MSAAVAQTPDQKTRKLLVTALQNAPDQTATVSWVVEHTIGLSKDKARRHLNLMADEGLVVREQNLRGGGHSYTLRTWAPDAATAAASPTPKEARETPTSNPAEFTTVQAGPSATSIAPPPITIATLDPAPTEQVIFTTLVENSVNGVHDPVTIDFQYNPRSGCVSFPLADFNELMERITHASAVADGSP